MKPVVKGFGSSNSESREELIDQLLDEGWSVAQRYALGEYYLAILHGPADEPVRRTGSFLQVIISGQPLPKRAPPLIYSDVWLFVGPFADDTACASFCNQLKEKLVANGYGLGWAVLRTIGEVPPGWIAIRPEDFRGLGSCNGMKIEF